MWIAFLRFSKDDFSNVSFVMVKHLSMYVSFGLLSTITEDFLFKKVLLFVWYYDDGWIWIFLFYESGSLQPFREKNNIQDENENMVWRIKSFIFEIYVFFLDFSIQTKRSLFCFRLFDFEHAQSIFIHLI
jgi:hypothetical protein